MTISFTDFSCVRCGNCCRWSGPVRVSDEEIAKIAEFLQINEMDFIEQFTTLTHDRRGLTLLENSDGSCIYLEETCEGSGCKINPVKPKQCSDFPYKWNFSGWENECEGAKK